MTKYILLTFLACTGTTFSATTSQKPLRCEAGLATSVGRFYLKTTPELFIRNRVLCALHNNEAYLVQIIPGENRIEIVPNNDLKDIKRDDIGSVEGTYFVTDKRQLSHTKDESLRVILLGKIIEPYWVGVKRRAGCMGCTIS